MARVSMELSRERKVFLGVALVAVSAFVIDRGLLGPSEAAASPVLAPGASGAAPGGVLPAADDTQHAGVDQTAATIARRIRELIIDKGVEGDEAGDAFSFPSDWLASPEAGAPTPGVETPVGASAPRRPSFTLSAAMPTQRGGVAVIDGRTYRTGDRVGAYTLTDVTDRTALLEGPAGVISLEIER